MLKKTFLNTKNSILNFNSLFVASLLNIFVPIGKKSNWKYAGNSTYQHISRMILTGFLIMIPLIVTYTIVVFLVDIIDGVLAPYVSLFFGGKRIFGLGALVLMVLVYGVGLLSTRYFGQKLGGYLLSEAIKKSFLLGSKRVWAHTCSLDHENALKNYLARGMKIFNSETLIG